MTELPHYISCVGIEFFIILFAAMWVTALVLAYIILFSNFRENPFSQVIAVSGIIVAAQLFFNIASTVVNTPPTVDFFSMSNLMLELTLLLLALFCLTVGCIALKKKRWALDW